ncbi:hypothetical protein N7488_004262 [Penicillium malachiteum]|nr:hypothetical protein N7488_004262 [Penicillium malachiteum]
MTGTSATEGLELAEIVFYAIAIIPAFFCFVTHGKHVGNGMAYHALSTTGHPNEAAEIISGVGLSPILLAALGILHEANHSIQSSFPSIFQGVGVVVPHATILAGIALAAASKGRSTLLEAGVVVLTIGWLIILAFVILSFLSPSQRMNGEKKLLFAVVIAMPLLGVRVIYSVIIAFVDGRAEGGNLAVQVIFGTVPEFLVVINYLFAGIMTRDMAQERQGGLDAETGEQRLHVYE